MKTKPETVRKVANLARINLSDKEVEKFAPEFDEILELFSQLSNIKTNKRSNNFKKVNEFREDIEKPCLSEEAIFRNTKNHEDRFFKGPKIK